MFVMNTIEMMKKSKNNKDLITACDTNNITVALIFKAPIVISIRPI